MCQIRHLGWSEGKAPERRKAERDFSRRVLEMGKKIEQAPYKEG